MAITLVAVPLIARGLLFARLRAPVGVPNVAWGATFAFAAIFWMWHSPVFYDETLRNNVIYWLMHISTVTAATALWAAIFSSSALLAFLVLFATACRYGCSALCLP